MEEWVPRTKLGRMVKDGKITDIDQILDRGLRILEPEIVDYLLPNLEIEYLAVGQLKGPRGGGRRTIFRPTARKTAEGSRLSYGVMAVVGNGDGYIGLGYGKSREREMARLKAIRNAKLNIIKIVRGCGSWECACGEPHSIPFKIEGKSGSVRVIFMPAPKGVGLAVNDTAKVFFRLAGVRDVWGKSFGDTDTRVNLAYAIFDALKKLSIVRVRESFRKFSGLVAGRLK